METSLYQTFLSNAVSNLLMLLKSMSVVAAQYMTSTDTDPPKVDTHILSLIHLFIDFSQTDGNK